MSYPNDDDGDVLRRMEEHGFDFSNAVAIDFNIDFDHWPVSDEALAAIRSAFPNANAIDPDEEDILEGNSVGYVQFQLTDRVTYGLVVAIQEQATRIASPFGGWCESWGVLQE